MSHSTIYIFVPEVWRAIWEECKIKDVHCPRSPLEWQTVTEPVKCSSCIWYHWWKICSSKMSSKQNYRVFCFCDPAFVGECQLQISMVWHWWPCTMSDCKIFNKSELKHCLEYDTIQGRQKHHPFWWNNLQQTHVLHGNHWPTILHLFCNHWNAHPYGLLYLSYLWAASLLSNLCATVLNIY